ncbi:hypothetical protein RSOLAG1IB_09842 [Rhizoctonia solani AG-1 IB]|uniref:Uncharacterized protein n=1 Tax=Thanatephorus cucumeris (strain AG1-IB / isolate 7/3/14) TaxID=1108050 RepID=A0A0B7FWF7_THACB|nr:hypothetical protein RSOLAG1IB_09842 [Rhizoctonia solani AG-1 IB]
MRFKALNSQHSTAREKWPGSSGVRLSYRTLETLSARAALPYAYSRGYTLLSAGLLALRRVWFHWKGQSRSTTT